MSQLPKIEQVVKTVKSTHYVIKATKANLEKLFSWVRICNEDGDFQIMIDYGSSKSATMFVKKNSWLCYDNDPVLYPGTLPTVINSEDFKLYYKRVNQ